MGMLLYRHKSYAEGKIAPGDVNPVMPNARPVPMPAPEEQPTPEPEPEPVVEETDPGVVDNSDKSVRTKGMARPKKKAE